MVKRIASVGILTFCLVAAYAALGQSERPAGGALPQLRSEGATSAQIERVATQSLPDAPSAQVQVERVQSVNEARWPLTMSETKPSGMQATEAISPPPLSATALIKTGSAPKKSDDFFSKYLNTSGRQNSRYQPSSSDKVMERATDAASRIFVTRDESGKRRLNTQYFLRVLTSVAADNASRRYRARSGTAPLSSFGSTVGNDAGINLLHEFGPGIRQKMAGHMPGVVSRIGERLIRLQNSK
jgi:hypothetical protein